MYSLDISKSSVNAVTPKSYGFFYNILRMPDIFFEERADRKKKKERKSRKGRGKGERNSAACTIKLTVGATDDQFVGFCGLPPLCRGIRKSFRNLSRRR